MLHFQILVSKFVLFCDSFILLGPCFRALCIVYVVSYIKIL